MNKPKTLDNREVSAFLADYLTAEDLCTDIPPADDIFAGALNAQTPGDTSKRGYSRSVLFSVLRDCQELSVAEVQHRTRFRSYSRSTLEGYAGRARVASRALANVFRARAGQDSNS